MAVGTDPTGIAVNPKKNEVYAVNTGSGTVSVIDATRNQVVATVTVHRKPYFISVNASGTLAYVANSASNNVSVIDLASRREIRTIPVGQGPGLAKISPDGNTVVVSNRISGSVSIIDAKTYRTRAVFNGCPQATDIAILPDSSKAYVACSGSHQVMDIGLAQPQNQNSTLLSDRLLALLDVGKTPLHLVLKPDGGEIFVCNFDSDSISEINTYTNEVGGAYLVGAHPAFGIVSTDNSLLWISNFNADTIGIYSIDDGTLIKPSIHVGAGPDALAFSSDGFFLLAVDVQSGDVSVVRTQSYTASGAVRIGSLFTMLPAGDNPSSIAVKSFSVK